MSNKINISKDELVPLALLDACEGYIDNKTIVQKLSFLLEKEELENHPNLHKFYKYNYGPYSKKLQRDINNLENKELVNISESKPKYELTSKGKKFVEKLKEEEREENTELKTDILCGSKVIHNKYKSLTTRQIINIIYKNYPEYKNKKIYLPEK